MAILTLLVIVLVIGGLLVLVYNGLVQRRVNVDNAWSQITVQLKRRHDLIPNLVETVKGYATHEKETLERVITARNAAVTATGASVADSSAAENMLSGALRQIFALSENYPNLKANENFSQLQEELSSTENRISFARQHYNDCVADFNASIQKVPGNLVAGFGNFSARQFFELDAAEAAAAQAVPKVSF